MVTISHEGIMISNGEGWVGNDNNITQQEGVCQPTDDLLPTTIPILFVISKLSEEVPQLLWLWWGEEGTMLGRWSWKSVGGSGGGNVCHDIPMYPPQMPEWTPPLVGVQQVVPTVQG